MRWEELFSELDREWEAAVEAEQMAEVADRTRAELAQIGLVDRLRGSVGASLRLHTGAGDLSGELARVAADCVLLQEGRAELVVPLSAVSGVEGLTDASTPAALVSEVDRRLGLASLLRAVARDRSAVTVLRSVGGTLHGTPQRVGPDHLDLAVHQPGDVPRADRITRWVAVPFGTIVALRRGP